MKVNIDELEKIILSLLLKLKKSKGHKVEINKDYYWEIDEEQLYNPLKEPTVRALGQLSDDLNELQRLLKSDETLGEAIAYDLKRVSEILKAISIENSTSF